MLEKWWIFFFFFFFFFCQCNNIWCLNILGTVVLIIPFVSFLQSSNLYNIKKPLSKWSAVRIRKKRSIPGGIDWILQFYRFLFTPNRCCLYGSWKQYSRFTNINFTVVKCCIIWISEFCLFTVIIASGFTFTDRQL